MIILIINTGSASKKYSLYENDKKIYSAHFETENDNYLVTEVFDSEVKKTILTEGILKNTQSYLLKSLLEKKIIISVSDISGIGIRIVAPGEYFLKHQIIDKEYFKKLKQALIKVPLHLGPVLEEIKNIKKVFGKKEIVGISDSAFHNSLPDETKYYAIPISDSRRLGLQKFGYHGISVKSVISQIKVKFGTLPSRIIVCHLGGGASITAIKDGLSVENSMGFTPLDGLVMATRVGEIDPGAVIYLSEKLGLKNKKLENYFNNKCGLLGLSNKSSDIRELLKFEEAGDEDSALALSVYVNRLKKYIGGAIAVLGGVDIIVFTGTVGERSFIMRDRICEGLDFLGIELDKDKNNKNESFGSEINLSNSKVKVLVIKTDEVEEIARETFNILSK